MSRLAAARYRQQARESATIASIGLGLLLFAGAMACVTFGRSWAAFLACLTFAAIGASAAFSWAIESRRCNRIASELERDLSKYSTLD